MKETRSPSATGEHRALWPVLVIAGMLVMTALQLHRQGRVLWCSCGELSVWAGDIWSMHNSQHLLDPYSFTHVLHGMVLCGVLVVFLFRMPVAWRLALAVSIEGLWEIVENSQWVIQRYRDSTVNMGYCGDSIINSMADVACCAVGFGLARFLGWRRSALLFVAVELALLVCIRDSLTLNVIMLVHPVEAIKSWQMVH